MVNIHLFDASGRLNHYKDDILALSHQTVTKVQTLMPVKNVDIMLCINQTGATNHSISGFAPSNDVVIIYLNQLQRPDFENNVKLQLPSIIAHELHHTMRWVKPGYGQTLVETFITEGLAQAFELDFLENSLPVFAKLTEPERLSELMDLARSEFHHNLSVYVDWFAGNQKRHIPQSAGYALGFDLVQRYLEKANITAGLAYAVDAKTVLETLGETHA